MSEENTADRGPHPHALDITRATLANETFRTALWTGPQLQLTVMSVEPGGEVGLEVHTDRDQFLRVEAGRGRMQMGPAKDELTFDQEVEDDWVVLVPAGTWHNLTNTGDEPLKLYSLYAPPEHAHGTVHATAGDAEKAEEAEEAAS